MIRSSWDHGSSLFLFEHDLLPKAGCRFSDQGGENLMTSARRLYGLATLLLGLSAATASASPARVYSNTNLREGPGTNFGVVTLVPAGSIVEVTGCAAEWCTTNWRGRVGYMIATHLDQRVGVVAQPVAVYPAPYIYGPPYFYGPRVFIGFGGYRHYGHYGRRRW
jgi:Bacterial SH3 domain